MKLKLNQKPIKNNKPEARFMLAAEKYLSLMGFTVMRINSSALKTEIGTFVKSYKLYGRGHRESQGFPDIISFKNNKFMVIEIKAKNGHLTQSQIDFKNWWESRGHKYNVAKNLDELIEIVRQFENN